jgi:hypothetical protein
MSIPMPESGRTAVANRPGMSWGVKSSFTRYIDAMPDGKRGAGHGATETGAGVYFFELDDASGYDPVSGGGVVKYRGDVRYKGHQGMLFVMIVDPWIEFRGTTAALTVLDAEHWPKRDRRIELATLALDEAATRQLPDGWAYLTTQLTEEGAVVFNEVYPVGELLDPVRYCATV